MLVAGQVGRGLTLRELLVRVQAEDAGVVQDAKLLVQDIEGTPDSRLRANRLVNSLNLSFRPLVKHTPRAAEIFAWLGTLPAGLPGVLVEAVFGDGAKRYSGRLLSLNMAELLGPDDRLILPGPVRWYARMQQGADLDAVPIIPPSRQDELVERSITAIATWLSASKAKLGRGGSTTACERAAAEGANLIALSSKVSGAPPKVLASMADAFAAYARLATHGAFQGTAVIVGEHVRTAMHLGESPSAIATASEALGDLYLRTDRLTEAEHAYGEALKIYRSIEAGIGEANTLRSMGDLYMRTDRTAKAEHVYKEALLLFQKIKYRLGEANTLLTLGDLYVRTSRLQDAERSYNDGALPLFREIEEKLGEANTLRALGDLYARTNRLKSEHLYNEALLIFQEIEEQVGKANTLQALGDLYMLKNRLSDAERMYNEALPIYRAFKDRIGEANTLKELGDVYARTNRVAAAENLYKESLSIHREIADRLGLANALHALGHLYTDSNRLTEAEHSFGEALPIYQAIEQKVGEATTLQGFGYLELKRNAPSSAFQYCLRALAIQNTVNDRLGIGGTHGLLARAASLANRSERAIVLGCRAFALLKQADDDMGQAIAAVDLVLALQEVQDGGFGAVMLLAWVLTSRISHPLADHFELIIRQHGIDPDTIATDAVHAQALTMLQTIEKRYEQILRERNEDPYSPLEPK